MKLIHIIASLYGGGRERRMLQLVKGLAHDHKIEQTIITFSNKKDYNIDFQSLKVDIIYLNMKSSFHGFTLLNQTFRQLKPDIVHSWCDNPTVMMSTSILKHIYRYKYIAGFVADGNRLTKFKQKISMHINFQSAESIVSNSKAGLIAKNAPLYKSKVIYNGFDFDRLLHLPNLDNIKKSLNITTPYIVSMVARFTPSKNYQMLLDTAFELQKRRNDITILAVGKGELLESFKEQTKKRNISNIIFTGFRNDVECIMKISTLSILFTNEEVHSEGVSNSIMESMAVGTPVIATDGGGTPEIITAGTDGFIVKPNDYKMAAEIIDKLLNDKSLLNKLSISAMQKIKNQFSLSKMTQEYLKLYKEL